MVDNVIAGLVVVVFLGGVVELVIATKKFLNKILGGRK